MVVVAAAVPAAAPTMMPLKDTREQYKIILLIFYAISSHISVNFLFDQTFLRAHLFSWHLGAFLCCCRYLSDIWCFGLILTLSHTNTQLSHPFDADGLYSLLISLLYIYFRNFFKWKSSSSSHSLFLHLDGITNIGTMSVAMICNAHRASDFYSPSFSLFFSLSRHCHWIHSIVDCVFFQHHFLSDALAPIHWSVIFSTSISHFSYYYYALLLSLGIEYMSIAHVYWYSVCVCVDAEKKR